MNDSDWPPPGARHSAGWQPVAPKPKDDSRKCHECQGTGECATCHGECLYDWQNTCVDCDDTGDCPGCQGYGIV